MDAEELLKEYVIVVSSENWEETVIIRSAIKDIVNVMVYTIFPMLQKVYNKMPKEVTINIKEYKR